LIKLNYFALSFAGNSYHNGVGIMELPQSGGYTKALSEPVRRSQKRSADRKRDLGIGRRQEQ